MFWSVSDYDLMLCLFLYLQSHLQNVPLAYLKAIEDSYKKNFLPKIGWVDEWKRSALSFIYLFIYLLFR